MKITPETIIDGYKVGIFPMADDDGEILWYEPALRGIIDFDNFHISKNLAKLIRKNKFLITINRAFSQVIQACSGRKETWISDEIKNLYVKLHQMGYAHSVETWFQDKLVGGLYGVAIGGAFFGESMFSLQPDTSKIALSFLVDRLRTRGFTLLDTQYITDHLARMGATEISKQEYRHRLATALRIKASFL